MECVDVLAALEHGGHFHLHLEQLLLRPGHEFGDRRTRIGGRRLRRHIDADDLAALTKIPLGEIIRECWGLIASMIAVLALLVAFPGLVLWLPRVLGYLK